MIRRFAVVWVTLSLALLGVAPAWGAVTYLPPTPLYEFKDSNPVDFRVIVNNGGNVVNGQWGWWNPVTGRFLGSDTIAVPGASSIQFDQSYNLPGQAIAAVILKFTPNAAIHFGTPTCTPTRTPSNCGNPFLNPPDPNLFSVSYTSAARLEYYDDTNTLVGSWNLIINLGTENTVDVASIISPNLLNNPGRVRLIWDASSIVLSTGGYDPTQGGQTYETLKNTIWDWQTTLRQDMTSQLIIYHGLVPEPSTWVTMGTGFGLLILGWMRRRKQG